MTSSFQYSEKELEIFGGIIRLIREGANPYSIKAADIAEASNVGKGTIYDYFDTKEEAISRAIIHNLYKELSNATEKILSKETFRERFYEVLNCIMDSMESNVCTFRMLLAMGGLKEFYEHLADNINELAELSAIMNRVIDSVLEMGEKEGIICLNESGHYKFMAVRGAVSGFAHCAGKKGLNNSLDKNELMDTAYRLLIKSLK